MFMIWDKVYLQSEPIYNVVYRKVQSINWALGFYKIRHKITNFYQVGFLRIQHDALSSPLKSEGLLLFQNVCGFLPLLRPLFRQVPLLRLLHRQLPRRHRIVLRHHRPEFFDFFSKFSNQLHVRVFVDGRLVDDVLGPVGVTERWQGLTVVDLSRAGVDAIKNLLSSSLMRKTNYREPWLKGKAQCGWPPC